jgi:hypothetical protein
MFGKYEYTTLLVRKLSTYVVAARLVVSTLVATERALSDFR